jgi:Zn-dependent protease
LDNGAIGAIILFISVFLHELMHSVIALRYGIKVRQIILFIFGGVSEIPEETRDFRKEFKIAIAGPAASFAIAGALAVSWWLYLKLVLQNSSYWPQNKSLKEFCYMALLSTPCLEDSI